MYKKCDGFRFEKHAYGYKNVGHKARTVQVNHPTIVEGRKSKILTIFMWLLRLNLSVRKYNNTVHPINTKRLLFTEIESKKSDEK